MVGFAKRGWICQEVNGELAKKIKPRLHGYNCLSGSGEENMFNRQELPQVGQELVSLKLT